VVERLSPTTELQTSNQEAEAFAAATARSYLITFQFPPQHNTMLSPPAIEGTVKALAPREVSWLLIPVRGQVWGVAALP